MFRPTRIDCLNYYLHTYLLAIFTHKVYKMLYR